MREPRELVEAGCRGARVDRLPCKLESLPQIRGQPARRDGAGCVEQDRAAAPTVAAGEDGANRLRVLVRRSPAKLLGSAALDTEVEWIDRALLDRAVEDLAHEVWPRRRELVDSKRTVDDERPLRAQACQDLGKYSHEPGRVDPHDLRAGTGRVRERAQHVEHGTRLQLAAYRRRMSHRRMVKGSEHEPEAELVDRARDVLGR
jgi:hypothetical protein